MAICSHDCIRIVPFTYTASFSCKYDQSHL